MIKVAACAVVLASTIASSASAQVNLTGRYRCVQACSPGYENNFAYVTQNGYDLNLLTESGRALRAWNDWFTPATRIWIDTLQEGAVFSPDGMTIQFDHGAIWQRDIGPPPKPIRR